MLLQNLTERNAKSVVDVGELPIRVVIPYSYVHDRILAAEPRARELEKIHRLVGPANGLSEHRIPYGCNHTVVVRRRLRRAMAQTAIP